MSDLPNQPPQGTPVVTRRMMQPADETPETYLKDGHLASKNPTAARQRAEFQLDGIKVTFDLRALQMEIDGFVQRDDLKGILKMLENSVMDIKTLDKHIFVTLKPEG